MEKIKVLIADDHRVVREGLAAILKTKEDIHVIGEAQDGMEAVEKARTLLPDVILMDVSMPRMGSRGHETNQTRASAHRDRGVNHVRRTTIHLRPRASGSDGVLAERLRIVSNRCGHSCDLSR